MIEINLPQTYDRITLQTFCDFHNAKTDIKRIMVITGKTKDQCEQMQFNTIDTIITMFEDAMEKGTPKHQNQFIVGSTKLGFIPDLNGLTFREYVDLDALSKTIWKEGEVNYSELPRLMSILFRPVIASVGDKYTIQKYDSGKINDYIKSIMMMTMDRVNGALVFFSTIGNELHNNIQVSLLRQMKTKMMDIYQLQVE
jgi:hypothetical protein